MSNECILIIDDSREIVKHLTERVLPSNGYRTRTALDGQSGLQLIRDVHPDLVILDLNLPDMSGIDVLQQMAQESISIPVVLMTGYGSELSAIEAFRLGAKDYLIKPFTTDELLGTIDRALTEVRLRHDKEDLAEQLRRARVEMSRQSQEMSTLFRIGKAVTSLLSVDRVLQRVLEAGTQLTNSQESMIWLLEPGGNELRVYSTSPAGQERRQRPINETTVPLIHAQAGQVIDTGQPLRLSAFTGDGLELAPGQRARAVLHVPLKLRGMTMGVLSVANTHELRAFSRRDEFLLSFLADYAAVALENARVLQAADRALSAGLDELNTLIEITRTITSSLDIDEIFRLSIRQIHSSWDVDAASIWLVNDSTQTLRLLANSGTPDQDLLATEVPLGKGFIGEVARTGNWIYTNNVADHELHYRLVDLQTGFRTESMLCVPLLFRNEVVGVMQLLNKHNGEFDDLDVERALAIATAVAIAVTNARLLETAETTASHQDELLASMSHDFRVPLSNISGFADELAQAGPLNPQQAAYLEQIRESSRRMIAMIDDLLELAQISVRGKEMFRPLDMDELASTTVEAYRPAAIRRRVTLELRSDSRAHWVKGHAAQLVSAVGNLLDNAIKHSPPDQRVVVAVDVRNNNLLVTVSDEGQGIPSADLPHIFEKFYRGAGASGHGLGLALVQAVAIRHDGDIQVESTPGLGSRFTLRLPLITEPFFDSPRP